MNQNSGLAKKRNFISPQKTQSSIRTFSANKPPPKKSNLNKSPQRLETSSQITSPLPDSPPKLKNNKTVSPLDRAYSAILPGIVAKEKPAKKDQENFFSPLIEEDEPNLEDFSEDQSLEEDKVSAGIMMDVQDHMQAEGFEIPTQDQATGSREEGGPLKISPDINKGFSTQDKIAFARAILADKSLLEEMRKVIGDSEREMINQLSRKIGLSNCEQEVLGIEQSKPHGNIPQKGRSLKESKCKRRCHHA
jgi:hypothetical protein